jgi:hypothetical protein
MSFILLESEGVVFDVLDYMHLAAFCRLYFASARSWWWSEAAVPPSCPTGGVGGRVGLHHCQATHVLYPGKFDGSTSLYCTLKRGTKVERVEKGRG